MDSVDEKLKSQMELVRQVVTLGLAERAQNRIKVRMPLQSLEIRKAGDEPMDEELIDIIKDELNVKEVRVCRDVALEAEPDKYKQEDGPVRLSVRLDLIITEELELEGLSREVIRQLQAMRKAAGYERDERVNVRYELSENAGKFRKMFEKFLQEIMAECLLSELKEEKEVMKEEFDAMDELESGGEKIVLIVRR